MATCKGCLHYPVCNACGRVWLEWIIDGTTTLCNWVQDKCPQFELLGALDGCGKFGDYLAVKEEDVEKAKEALVQQIHVMIDTLAKEEKFWIVKDQKDIPELRDGAVNVGWTLEVPQFEKPKTGKWVEYEPGKFRRE